MYFSKACEATRQITEKRKKKPTKLCDIGWI